MRAVTMTALVVNRKLPRRAWARHRFRRRGGGGMFQRSLAGAWYCSGTVAGIGPR